MGRQSRIVRVEKRPHWIVRAAVGIYRFIRTLLRPPWVYLILMGIYQFVPEPTDAWSYLGALDELLAAIGAVAATIYSLRPAEGTKLNRLQWVGVYAVPTISVVASVVYHLFPEATDLVPYAGAFDEAGAHIAAQLLTIAGMWSSRQKRLPPPRRK